MERVVSDLKYTRTDRKSVLDTPIQDLYPRRIGETAIPPALFPVAEAISSTSVGQARTHCVHPIHATSPRVHTSHRYSYNSLNSNSDEVEPIVARPKGDSETMANP